MMDIAHKIVTQLGLSVALVMVFLSFFVFRKRDELGKHAAQNTAATLLIYGLNIVMMTLFVKDINRGMQKAYNALGIPTLPADTWDGWPILLVALIGLIARDFADYWAHRLMHTRWGWPTHAAHHSDTHVNAFTGYRIHFLEGMVMVGMYVILLTWLQMPKAIPLVVVFTAIHVKYVHMNLDWDHGPFKYLLASPRFHRWHHADAPEAYGKNLANVIPLWDVLFGTYYNPGVCREPMGALKSGVNDKNPLDIYTYPFREWARMIREAVTRRGSDTVHPAE